MFIEKEKWDKFLWVFKFLNARTDLISEYDKSLVYQLCDCIDDIQNNTAEKVYAITNNAVVDDEIYYGIYGIAFNEKEAKKLFKQAVKDIKKDADFDNLDAIDLQKQQYYDDEEWYFNETEDSFELYLNGNYNSNNYSVEIKEFYIDKENELENNIKSFEQKSGDELCI